MVEDARMPHGRQIEDIVVDQMHRDLAGRSWRQGGRNADRDPPQDSTTKHTSRGARIAFWILAPLGIPVMVVAWSWYGFAQFEAQTEQPKALAASSTMAGFAETVGGVPLVLAHLVGVILLLLLGWLSWRGKGVMFGLVVVVVTSLVGIGAAQLLWEGELFKLGINNVTWVP